jgi:PAS domain S-box-containing protein
MSPLRVLLVEDCEDDALLIVNSLRSFCTDLETRRIEDEEQMRAALAEVNWDLVLCDFSLPHFSAPDALKLLREMDRDIPFIIVSGAVGEEAAVDAVKQGAEDYLNKQNINRLPRVIERSLAEVENRRRRRAAEEALFQSEARFRQVVENITEVFWAVEIPSGRFTYVSPGYERIWGRSSDSLYKDTAGWSDSVHPDDRQRVAEKQRQVEGPFNLTYRIIRPDGTLRWIRDRAFPVRSSGGEVKLVVGVAEDITEQKKLEEQFLQAQRVEAVGTLAGGVAHDLNNILSPILIGADLLIERMKEGPDRSILEMVAAQSRRGAEIIKQLLTFSRRIDSRRTDLQVPGLIRELESMIRETFPKEIQVQCFVPTDLWSLQADSTQLHQVLLNLCVNARDAMPAGGRLLLEAKNVTLSREDGKLLGEYAEGPYVEFLVHDTGTGIAPEIMGRIFDPFFSTKALGKGTGLGLSTVIGIVKNHEGFVRVESTPGKGSTFRVFLPANAGKRTEIAKEVREPYCLGNGQLILVVDDEVNMRVAMSELLVSAQYRVCTATDGEDALRVFRKNEAQIRLVITDMMMPVMNGMALIEQLRRLSPSLSILASVGIDSPGVTDSLAAHGVADILMKPYDGPALLRKIQQMLQVQTLRSADMGAGT